MGPMGITYLFVSNQVPLNRGPLNRGPTVVVTLPPGKSGSDDEERQRLFSGATTVCQGYDIKGSSSFLYSWERLARFYNWAITNGALKSTINRHGKMLYSLFDQRTISSATCIQDEERQRLFSGATTVCQGYDIKGSSSFLYSWDRLARFYNWAITNGALKSTINRHGKMLYNLFDQRTISSATCIQVCSYNINTIEFHGVGWGHDE
eukprot:sb/3470374/